MKSIKLLSILLILAFLLAVCGGQTEEAAPEGPVEEGAAQEEAAPAEPGEKITLRLWSHQNAAFQAGNEAIIAKFTEQNPNIEVVYETFEYELYIQTLQTSMPAGTEADVIEMFGTWVCSYADGGRLLTVPEDMLTYADAQQIFFQAPLDGYYCDNRLYGIPHEFNLENGGALVNPAYFEAESLTYPPNWVNFSDLRADAMKMTKFDGETMTRAGFNFVTGDGLSFTILAMILQQGGNYFAEDGKHFNFNSPESKAAIQLMVDMAQKDKVVDPVLFNDEANWVGESFFAGSVAIGFVGSWAAGEGMINYPDMVFDYIQIPPYFGSEHKFAADFGLGQGGFCEHRAPAGGLEAGDVHGRRTGERFYLERCHQDDPGDEKAGRRSRRAPGRSPRSWKPPLACCPAGSSSVM